MIIARLKTLFQKFHHAAAVCSDAPVPEQAAADWHVKTVSADPHCLRTPLSGLFPTILALWSLRIPVTCKLLARLAQCTLLEDKLTRIIDRQPFLCMDEQGNIRPNFALSQLAEVQVDLTDTLIDLFLTAPLDDDELDTLTSHTFSFACLTGERTPPAGIDPCRVLAQLEANPGCVERLKALGRIHTLRVARLLMDISDLKVKQPHDEWDLRIKTVVSDSFTALLDELTSAGVEQKVRVWGKYFQIVTREKLTMPGALLTFITAENHKQITDYVKSYLNAAEKRKAARDQLAAIRSCAVAVYNRILSGVDPEDCVCALLLAGLLMDENRYEEARAMLIRSSNGSTRTSFNALTALLKSYEKEIREIKAERASLPRSDATAYAECTGRIRLLSAQFRELCETSEQRLRSEILAAATPEDAERSKFEYVAVVAKHARSEKESNRYDSAYRLLSELPTDYPRMSCVYIELGMLHQTRGSERRRNQYYDPLKAIEMFERAMETLTEETDTTQSNFKYSAASILLPLANTYVSLGQPDMAISTCNRLLAINRKQPQAIGLLKRLTA